MDKHKCIYTFEEVKEIYIYINIYIYIYIYIYINIYIYIYIYIWNCINNIYYNTKLYI